MVSPIPEKSLCCNSNDIDKLPTEGILNGQPILNMDNGDVYMFDADEKKWKLQTVEV